LLRWVDEHPISNKEYPVAKGRFRRGGRMRDAWLRKVTSDGYWTFLVGCWIFGKS